MTNGDVGISGVDTSILMFHRPPLSVPISSHVTRRKLSSLGLELSFLGLELSSLGVELRSSGREIGSSGLEFSSLCLEFSSLRLELSSLRLGFGGVRDSLLLLTFSLCNRTKHFESRPKDM